jgi:hypothetical protein
MLQMAKNSRINYFDQERLGFNEQKVPVPLNQKLHGIYWTALLLDIKSLASLVFLCGKAF